ncbi:response regulator [Litoribacillus peritrichatus]|uniref:histidine kinase n=1 Tax=Litoribacillus peritrichatus TaxID=718191 RepID=A0ABP7MYJ9_9GAMM
MSFFNVKTRSAWLCLVIGTFIGFYSAHLSAAPLLDLSGADFSEQNVHPLDTEWGIIWNRFSSPTIVPETTQPYVIPSVWNNVVRPDGQQGPLGAATLYLDLKLPKNIEGVYLKLSDLPSAGVVWANGIKVIEQGTPALSAELEQPGYSSKTAYISAKQERIRLAIHTSNFHYKEGGFWSSLLITGPSGLNQLVTLPTILDSALTVLLLIFGGLFISLYLARKKETAALFFGCFCLAVGFRNGITGEHILNNLLPVLTWNISERLEYICFYISVPLFIAFVNRLYPHYQSHKTEIVFSAIAVTFSILTLALHSTQYTLLAIPYQAIASVAVIYILRIAILAFLHKRKSAILFGLSCLIFIVSFILDLLTHNMILQLPMVTEWGVTAFLILQAWLLNQRYAFSLTNEELLSERLQRQNIQLQKIDAMKDDFLAQTSHELRTPIHGISALSDLVLKQEQNIDKDSQTNLRLIHSSSIRLANLVNDILDLSSIKHNNLKLSLTSVSVAPLIEQVTTSLRPLLKGRPVTLQTKIPDQIPNVMADEDRLQQILFNLIGNAIKFTSNGHINVIVEQEPNEKLKISIRDTGLGIDHSETSEIFEAYKQGQQQGEVLGGHGLGLTITKDLLSLHNSELQVRSIPGHGSTFYFTLDTTTYLPKSVTAITKKDTASTAEDRRETYRPDMIPEAQAQQPQSQHALVVWAVDDEPINLQIIQNQLTTFGYQCRCFSSGQQILEALPEYEQPDLVLLDIMMPGMSGLEVCRAIRKQFSALELPIIMLTALQQTQDIVQAFEAGASDYITKPYNQPELHARVEAHLKASLSHELAQNNERLISELEAKEQLETRLQKLESVLSHLSISQFPDQTSNQLPSQTANESSVSASPESDINLAPGLNRATKNRINLVKAARLAIRVWEKHTGKTKASLAEESKIWRVYIDGGSIKTRTLDKYLNEQTLPKNPRWRSVIKTIDFVLLNCDLEETEKSELTSYISLIEQSQM